MKHPPRIDRLLSVAGGGLAVALALLLGGCQRPAGETQPAPVSAAPAPAPAAEPAASATPPVAAASAEATADAASAAAAPTAAVPAATAELPAEPPAAAASAAVAVVPENAASAASPVASQAAAPLESVPEPEVAAGPARPGESYGHVAGLHRVPDPLKLRSSAVMVVDAASGEMLYGKNESAVLPVASLTKLMTAIVLRDASQALDEPITITEDDKDREKNSRSRLRVGTTLTRGVALQLALMSSENRAAHALARHYPGGVPAFVAAMNRKATALGLNDTRFADPTGLSSQNQSSARDIARLARAAARDELLRDYSTTTGYVLPVGKRALQYRNSNRLVRRGNWDISLQKTGFTNEAGHNVVMQARLGGRDVILVLLDAADKSSRGADAERIRRWVSEGRAQTTLALNQRGGDAATAPGSRGSR
jgi:D-alanyl-D-alanine endopeptidase (penicillin-binding protein 7)